MAAGINTQTEHDDRIVEATLPELFGGPTHTTLHNGKAVPVVQLNAAATTPPFRASVDAVLDFFRTYGALHRRSGPRARRTCEAIDRSIHVIREFVGCPKSHHTIFTQNTSAAINLFARLQRFRHDDIVITSETEHTSNYLPWKYNSGAQVVELPCLSDGAIDFADLKAKLGQFGKRVKLIAVSGASNLTGHVADLSRLAELAGTYGAQLFIDAAQLAPHRSIHMEESGVDALAFSAHKLYAPFGLGVLFVPGSLLTDAPADPGGGSVDMISDRGILWSSVEERHQTGTWNATGIVALAAACETIRETGWQAIRSHERQLTAYTASRLEKVPGLTVHVPLRLYTTEDRIGTFPFTLEGYHHALLAAVLEHEFGIEVRSGTICNHRLVRRWFNVSDEQQDVIEARIKRGDRLASYGIVRASLGVYNQHKDIDCLVEALTEISREGHDYQYREVPRNETFKPV